MVVKGDLIAILLGISNEEYNRWCLAASVEGDDSLCGFIKRIIRNYMSKGAEE